VTAANFWDQDDSGARPSAVGTAGGSGIDGFGLPTALDFKFCDFYLGIAVFGHLTFFRPLFYAFYRIWLDLAMLQNFKLCVIILSGAGILLFFSIMTLCQQYHAWCNIYLHLHRTHLPYLASEESFHGHFGLKKLCNMTSSETVVSALPPLPPPALGGGQWGGGRVLG
jgi:hypothetical protein